MKCPRLLYIPLISTLLWLGVGGYQLWQVRSAPIGDFANYYYASQAYLEGALGQDIYEPFAFNLWVNERSPEPVFVNYAPVPPISILVYLPIALFEEVGRAKIWFGVGGLVFLGVVLGSWKLEVGKGKLEGGSRRSEVGSWKGEEKGGGRGVFWLLGPFICWGALFNNFYQGQSYLYLVGMLMLGYLFWERGKRFWAALFWALPIALKIFPAILLLFLLIKRDWVSFFLTGTMALLFSLLPMLFLPFDLIYDYFIYILPRLLSGEINDPFTILYQSARVLLDKLFVFDQHLNPNPVAHLPWLSTWLYVLFQCVILAWVVGLVSHKKVSSFAGFALVILSGLLVSGYGSSYSMLLLLLPLLTCPGLYSYWLYCFFGSIILFLAGNMPVYLLKDWPLFWQFPRLYALLAFFGLVVWVIKPTVKWQLLLLLGLLLIGKEIGSFGDRSDTHPYYLSDGRQGIIYDYKFAPKGLALTFFNAKGSQNQVIAVQDSIWQDPGLVLKNHQIYFEGQQLTFNNSRKLKPMRLNKSAILYLSDEGRGVGFYTLRKIAIP